MTETGWHHPIYTFLDAEGSIIYETGDRLRSEHWSGGVLEIDFECESLLNVEQAISAAEVRSDGRWSEIGVDAWRIEGKIQITREGTSFPYRVWLTLEPVGVFRGNMNWHLQYRVESEILDNQYRVEGTLRDKEKNRT